MAMTEEIYLFSLYGKIDAEIEEDVMIILERGLQGLGFLLGGSILFYFVLL